CLGVLFCPPIAQRARCIDLAALIVEAVSKFVTDNPAGCAIINCGIGIRVENRRLKNSGRKDNVAQTTVVSIIRLRRHAPIRAIDRTEKAAGVKTPIKLCASSDVAYQIAAANYEL